MATLAEMKIALVNAHNAGDQDAARKLAAFIAQAQPDLVSQIPGMPALGTQQPKPEQTIADKAIGVGETALAAATGATGGLAGQVAGTLKGLAESILNGSFGTPEAAREVAKSAQGAAGALTYAPRTDAGQEMTAAVGRATAPLVAVAPMLNVTQALARGAVQAAPAVTAVAGRGAQAIKTGAGKAAEAVQDMTGTKPPTLPGGSKPPTGSTSPSGAEIGELVRKASSDGLGSVKAKEMLAEAAKINPEAKAAADRLGIDLPADVFSDNQILRETAGLTRSAAGSEASGAWRDTLLKAAEKADEVMANLDAAPDISSVSEKVLSSLKSTRNDLATGAKAIYESVDSKVPKDTIVAMPKLRATLESIKKEVGEGGLSSQERAMLKMLDSGDVTYGRLAREKNLIGQAIAGKDSPYGNMDAGALKRLYGSIAEDQLENVAAFGGKELRDQLRAANFMTKQAKGMEARIVNAFGKEIDGSIASLMRRSIESASKGDSAALTKLLKVVPEDLQKETLLSSLMNVTRAKGGQLQGGFGFSEFAKTYRGLRENAPIYAQFSKIVGKDRAAMLRDLYEVSKRVTDARANVLTTGKANQALVGALNAEGILEKILKTTAGKAAITGAGATAGGPVGAALASTLANFMASGKTDAIKRAGELFRSPEFQRLMVEAATKETVSEKTLNAVLNSAKYKRAAKNSLPNIATETLSEKQPSAAPVKKAIGE